MFDTDIAISLPRVHCGETIRARTTHKGSVVQGFPSSRTTLPTTGVQRPEITFLRSDEHLQQWLDAQKVRREEIRLTMDKALWSLAEQFSVWFSPAL
jgi:hypothetical protein